MEYCRQTVLELIIIIGIYDSNNQTDVTRMSTIKCGTIKLYLRSSNNIIKSYSHVVVDGSLLQVGRYSHNYYDTVTVSTTQF